MDFYICGFVAAIGLVSVSLLSPHQDIAAQDRVAGSGAVRRSAKCWAAVTIHRPPQEQLRRIAKNQGDTIAIGKRKSKATKAENVNS